jgi:hypothetical protein
MSNHVRHVSDNYVDRHDIHGKQHHKHWHHINLREDYSSTI